MQALRSNAVIPTITWSDTDALAAPLSCAVVCSRICCTLPRSLARAWTIDPCRQRDSARKEWEARVRTVYSIRLCCTLWAACPGERLGCASQAYPQQPREHTHPLLISLAILSRVWKQSPLLLLLQTSHPTCSSALACISVSCSARASMSTLGACTDQSVMSQHMSHKMMTD